MARRQTFERTETIQTFSDDTDQRTLSFQGFEVDNEPAPGGEATVSVTVEGSDGGEYYVTFYRKQTDGEAVEESDIAFSIDQAGRLPISTTINAPDVDSFDIIIRGGVIE